MNEMPNREGPIGIAIVRLVVVEVALDAGRTRAAGRAMAFPTDRHPGEQDIGGLGALGRLAMAFDAGERAMDAVVEHAVRQPARGYRRRDDLGKAPARPAEDVTELALLAEHLPLHDSQL